MVPIAQDLRDELRKGEAGEPFSQAVINRLRTTLRVLFERESRLPPPAPLVAPPTPRRAAPAPSTAAAIAAEVEAALRRRGL